MTTAVLLLVVIAAGISAVLTAGLIRLGRRLGAMDTDGSEGHAKILRNVPNVGGIAMAAAILMPLAAAIGIVNGVDSATLLEWLPDLRGPTDDPSFLIERMRHSTPAAAALAGCVLLIHILGVVDDRRPLGPILKLVIEFGCAAVMAVFFEARLFTMLGTVPSIVIGIVWIVLITNAINFLDNMDGLSGGVVAIASLLFMAAAIVNDQYFIAAVLALVAGSAMGFLVFNVAPAKIFMGDGGSLILGFLLGVLTARTTFVHSGLGGGWYAVFMPLLVLAIPLYDFLTVTTIRVRRGQSPFVGDQQHFSHRLVDRGLSPRGAVAVIWGLTAVTGIGGIALGAVAPWVAILIGVQALMVLLVVGLLEHTSRRAATGRTP